MVLVWLAVHKCVVLDTAMHALRLHLDGNVSVKVWTCAVSHMKVWNEFVHRIVVVVMLMMMMMMMMMIGLRIVQKSCIFICLTLIFIYVNI